MIFLIAFSHYFIESSHISNCSIIYLNCMHLTFGGIANINNSEYFFVSFVNCVKNKYFMDGGMLTASRFNVN